MKEKYKSNLSFTDLLFNMLVGFVFLFVIAFLLINPVAKKADIVVPAEYLIVINWNEESSDDIDLWIKDNTHTVGFIAKDRGVMHLDRDDLGKANDTVNLDGKIVTIPVNREVVSIRGKIPNTYKVAVHLYRRYGSKIKSVVGDDTGAESITFVPSEPVEVQVEIIKVNPYKIVYSGTLKLTDVGQIENVKGFTVDEENKVTEVFDFTEQVLPGHSRRASSSLPPPLRGF